MGRGRRGGRSGGRGGGRGRGRGQDSAGRGEKGQDNFVTQDEKRNKDFEDYYRAQGIVPDGDWDQFLETLRNPLPVTFRINGSGRFADHLRDKLQSDFFSHFSEGPMVTEDGEAVKPPRPLPWYPNNYAWHMDFSRGQLRKLPLLEAIHEYLKKANDHGSISRQEAVSMVPPLFLDVQPQHKVFDMCAAPGSKTFQLLEAVHAAAGGAGAQGRESDPPAGIPQGYVVANDADFKRCMLLTHQTKRGCSPCLLVTNHNAEAFPMLKTKSHPEGLRFDRVLCDVPCSGDGTLRKAPDIWRRWNVSSGNGLHIMQLRIAMQGIRLLEVGGLMVYSTCTFNPVEDEAVVAELLTLCGSALELCDMSAAMPQLKRLPGKHHWRVRDKERWYESWEEAKAAEARLEPSCFPSEAKAKLPLGRCMRFLPHHQDTGGFFVAVLRKTSDLPPSLELPVSQRPASTSSSSRPQKGPKPPPKITNPLATAKEAAEAAVAAAEAAISALEAGDSRGEVAKAARAAAEAGELATHASNALRAQADREAAAGAGAAAAARGGADQEMADADGGAEGGAAGGDEAGGRPEGEEDGEDAAEAAAAERAAAEEEAARQEEVEDKAAAAAPVGKPAWIRGGGGRNREGGGRHSAIDPVVPVFDEEAITQTINYYGLSPDFPFRSQVVSRNPDISRPKRLYLISRQVLDLLLSDEQEQLKIISAGVKVFERQDIREGENGDGALVCSYRVAQEGLPYLLPFITRQRLALDLPEFLALLQDRSLILPNSRKRATILAGEEGAPEAAAAAEAGGQEAQEQQEEAAAAAAGQQEGGAEGEGQEGDQQQQQPGSKKRPLSSARRMMVTDPGVLADIARLKPGCVVVELSASAMQQLGLGADSTDGVASVPMVLSAWKGRATIAIMVEKAETMQMVDSLLAAAKRAGLEL